MLNIDERIQGLRYEQALRVAKVPDDGRQKFIGTGGLKRKYQNCAGSNLSVLKISSTTFDI